MRIVSNEQSVAYHNSETTLNDNNKKNLKKYGSDSDLSIDKFRFSLMYLHGKTVFFFLFFLFYFYFCFLTEFKAKQNPFYHFSA